MNAALVHQLRQITRQLADVIEPASRGGDHALFNATVKARDAIVEMRAAAGDEDAVQVMEEHYSFDELRAMAAARGYSGVGCRDCGPETDVEGSAAEFDGATVTRQMYCDKCGRAWVNLYQFKSRERIPPLG